MTRTNKCGMRHEFNCIHIVMAVYWDYIGESMEVKRCGKSSKRS